MDARTEIETTVLGDFFLNRPWCNSMARHGARVCSQNYLLLSTADASAFMKI